MLQYFLEAPGNFPGSRTSAIITLFSFSQVNRIYFQTIIFNFLSKFYSLEEVFIVFLLHE